MKRIFSVLLLCIFSFTSLYSHASAGDTNDYFVVTAYYSPLPDQSYYLTGNYYDEIRLNGQGIAGASGKGVFSGMLAAPKSYDFGTKIYLEGLGVGSVEDRGGAIVNAGQRGYKHDRIDVWMGYGEEGLRRALYWGKRTVKGKILSSGTLVTLDNTVVASPEWVAKSLKTIPDIFHIGLGKGSDVDKVKELQSLLAQLEMYSGEINGVYNNEIIDIVYNFQIENEIISPGELYGAGYWGNKTRSLFLKQYLDGDFDKVQESQNVEVEVVTEETEDDFLDNLLVEQEVIQEEVAEFELPSVLFEAAKTYDQIVELQNILTQLEFYTHTPTGVYDTPTIDAVYDFQVSEGIVSSAYDFGAGSYGPKTRTALLENYKTYLDKKSQEEEQAERKKELEDKIQNLLEASTQEARKQIDAIGTPEFGEVGVHIRELQLLLKDLGYFEHKDTAIFGEITKQSLIEFQIDRGVIAHEKVTQAGVYDEVTKNQLINTLAQELLEEKVEFAGIDIYEI